MHHLRFDRTFPCLQGGRQQASPAAPAAEANSRAAASEIRQLQELLAAERSRAAQLQSHLNTAIAESAKSHSERARHGADLGDLREQLHTARAEVRGL